MQLINFFLANCTSDICHNGGICIAKSDAERIEFSLLNNNHFLNKENTQLCICSKGFQGSTCQYGKLYYTFLNN